MSTILKQTDLVKIEETPEGGILALLDRTGEIVIGFAKSPQRIKISLKKNKAGDYPAVITTTVITPEMEGYMKKNKLAEEPTIEFALYTNGDLIPTNPETYARKTTKPAKK